MPALLAELHRLLREPSDSWADFSRAYGRLVRRAARLVMRDYAAGAVAFQTLYRAIGYVRSRPAWGRRAAHEMVVVWATLPAAMQPLGLRLAQDAVDLLVRRFGSWRDAREVAEAVRRLTANNTQHPLAEFCVRLICDRLEEDRRLLRAGRTEALSLCAKWAPREGSARHSWIFTRAARRMFDAPRDHDREAHDREAHDHDREAREAHEAHKAATKRARTNRAKGKLRRLLSALNGPAGLGTLEADMCARRWDRICAPSRPRVPRNAAYRHVNALMNVYPDGTPRVPRPSTMTQGPFATTSPSALDLLLREYASSSSPSSSDGDTACDDIENGDTARDDPDDRATLLGPVDPTREALAARFAAQFGQDAPPPRAEPKLEPRGLLHAEGARAVAPIWAPRYGCWSVAAMRAVIWQQHDG